MPHHSAPYTYASGKLETFIDTRLSPEAVSLFDIPVNTHYSSIFVINELSIQINGPDVSQSIFGV